MTWFGLILTVLFVISTGLNILLIGKRREPITPSVALGLTIGNTLLIAGILTVGTGHV